MIVRPKKPMGPKLNIGGAKDTFSPHSCVNVYKSVGLVSCNYLLTNNTNVILTECNTRKIV